MSLAVAAPAEDAVKQIQELEQQIARAVVERDAAFVERVWDDDFAYTGVRGEVKTKTDILAEIKAGELTFEVLKFDDIKVRLFGETAVVTGRATTKGRSPQGEISGVVRYTRVYFRRDGAWRLVAFQGTPAVSEKK
jgi:uncharacterized protein (TIGR02246 family)